MSWLSPGEEIREGDPVYIEASTGYIAIVTEDCRLVAKHEKEIEREEGAWLNETCFTIEKAAPTPGGKKLVIKSGEGVWLKCHNGHYWHADELGAITTYPASDTGDSYVEQEVQQRRFVVTRSEKNSDREKLMPSLATANEAVRQATTAVNRHTVRPWWSLWSQDLITYGAVKRKVFAKLPRPKTSSYPSNWKGERLPRL